MILRLDHTALVVRDLDAAVRFYEDAFGFELYSKGRTSTGLWVAYLRLGEAILELTGVPEAQPRESGGPRRTGPDHIAFAVRDLEAEIQRLQGLGLVLDREPQPTFARVPQEEGWRRCTFRGPEGETIELRGK